MPIVVIFLFVAGAIAVAVLYPHLRAIALAVISVFAAIFTAYFFFSDTESDRAVTRISVEELVLSDVELEHTARYSAITGRVLNASESYQLRTFDIEVTMFDCETETQDLSECATVAQDQTTSRIIVPAGQTRDFRAVLDLRSAAATRNIAKWDHKVTNVTATPQ